MVIENNKYDAPTTLLRVKVITAINVAIEIVKV